MQLWTKSWKKCEIHFWTYFGEKMILPKIHFRDLKGRFKIFFKVFFPYLGWDKQFPKTIELRLYFEMNYFLLTRVKFKWVYLTYLIPTPNYVWQHNPYEYSPEHASEFDGVIRTQTQSKHVRVQFWMISLKNSIRFDPISRGLI